MGLSIVPFDFVRNEAYILKMGFKEVRSRAIQAIRDGGIQHESRDEIEEKNLLVVGDVTSDQVIHLLNSCRGTQYSSSPHHMVPGVDVHVFKPEAKADSTAEKEFWYIKLYFLDPDIWFISVHKSKKGVRS